MQLLTESRISRLGAISFGVFLAIALGYLGFSSLWRSSGYVIVSDLSVFWTAAQLAAQGKASSAYQEPVLHATLAAVVPSVKGNFGWFYPPVFYLLVRPLALFRHYFPAYLAWEIPTMLLFLTEWRRWASRPSSWWVLAGFGAVWLNLLHGQNGFLTAAVVGFTLRLMVRRSPWAGVGVGLLFIKPQLMLVPALLLLVTRNGRGLLLAGMTVGVTNGIALMVLGSGTLEGWWQSLHLARRYLEQDGMGSQYWLNMPTVFAQMRLWGVSVMPAYIIHGIAASAAITMLLVLWRRCSDVSVRLVATVLVSLMISPYLMDYDLLWLIWVLVIIQEKWAPQWTTGEQILWLMIWLAPVMGRWWVGQFGFHWLPWLLWGQLIQLWFRTERMNQRMIPSEE